MMDTFLKQENYRDAVKVAIQLMLQEDFDHPITSHMALYSCYAYIMKPQPQPWDPQPHAKPEEPVEEVKVRVDYIREPYFDDHFDLTDSQHLIGKTLVGLAKYFSSKLAVPITKTSMLVGWMMYQKYDKVLQTLEEMSCSSSKPVVYKEWLEYCQKLAEQSSTLPDGFSEKLNSYCNKLLSENYHTEENLLQKIHQLTTDVVKNQERLDIDDQLQCYESWGKRRIEEVEKQIKLVEAQQRVSALQQKKKELEEKEEKIYFFDNIDKWELLYEEKEELRQLKAQETTGTGKKLSSKALRSIEEDNYVPPEVQKTIEGEPCLAILNNFYNDGIKWHDVACHHEKPFVCEDSDELINFVRSRNPQLTI
nr:EOG090X05Q1 [Cyclestheria hislopi]